MLTNRIICILSVTLLFTFPTESYISPFQTTQVVVKENEGMVQKDYLGMIKEPILDKFEKDKIQFDKKKTEELRLKELEKQKKNEAEWQEQSFVVSYYGATYNECGNNEFITASGIPVQEGHIAVPKEVPFGSKIIFDGIEYIATDRGNPNYIKILNNGSMKVDVFISRLASESTERYEKRVNAMGLKKVVGKIKIKE